MVSDANDARDKFIDALATLLQANRNGGASLRLRTELAKARADAVKLLTTKQYDGAVFDAFKSAGWRLFGR